jgi:hypothetical protein
LELNFREIKGLEAYNLLTGLEMPVNSHLDEEGITVKATLEPLGTRVYCVSKLGHDTCMDPEGTEKIKKEVHGTPVVKDFINFSFDILGYNTLPLKDLKFSMQTKGMDTVYHYKTNFTVEDMPESLSILLDDVEYRSALMGFMDLRVFVNGQRATG